jgi:hypothetical protein
MRPTTFSEPVLTKTAAAAMDPDPTFNANAKLSRRVQLSLLYLQK